MRTRIGWLAGIAALLLAAGVGCQGGSAPSDAVPATIAPPLAPGDTGPVVRKLARKGWVEVTSEVVASESESPAEARERALSAARRAAVESVAGIRVRSSLVTWEGVRGADASSLVQALTASRADALVLDEELVGTQMQPLRGGGYRMRVVMRARVLDRSATSDPGFRIEVQLGRERFLHGEDVDLAVRSSRDSRIYVLGITDDGAAILLPNKWLPDTRAEAGEWLHFPGNGLRERGVRLIAQVPPGRESATEALVVVALRGDRTLDGVTPRGDRAFLDADAEGAGHLLADLLTPLSGLAPEVWAFDQVVYEVYAR